MKYKFNFLITKASRGAKRNERRHTEKQTAKHRILQLSDQRLTKNLADGDRAVLTALKAQSGEQRAGPPAPPEEPGVRICRVPLGDIPLQSQEGITHHPWAGDEVFGAKQ